MTANTAIPAFSTAASPAVPFIGPDSSAIGSFTAGVWTRDFTSHFNIGTGNGTVFGFVLTLQFWMQLLTGSFTKLNTQILDLTFTKNWSRVLVN